MKLESIDKVFYTNIRNIEEIPLCCASSLYIAYELSHDEVVYPYETIFQKRQDYGKDPDLIPPFLAIIDEDLYNNLDSTLCFL